MKSALLAIALAVAAGGLAACQTSQLKPLSGNSTSAIVEYPILVGRTHITVSLGGKEYTGLVGDLQRDTSGEQARRFGWAPGHKHPFIKQEMKFLYGTTILTAADGSRLSCDHLQHGDDWRLRCKTAAGEEIALNRVK